MSDDTLRLLRDSAADFATLDAARVRRLRGTDPGFERGAWQQMADMGWLGVLVAFYKARPSTIYGGRNEIQRNILARQVLNLPG